MRYRNRAMHDALRHASSSGSRRHDERCALAAVQCYPAMKLLQWSDAAAVAVFEPWLKCSVSGTLTGSR